MNSRQRSTGPPGARRHAGGAPAGEVGVAVRRTALGVLARVDEDGAFSNIALPAALERSDLDERDRAMVTDLVYGTIRMRRACNFLVERFLVDPPPGAALRPLLLGAYQLAFRDDVPSYAAVSATVGAAPKRFRGLVNAVLRRVAEAAVEFPSPAVELSYPDWIVEVMTADHGREIAMEALASMDEPAVSHVREDGYVQDLASQWVASHVADLMDADRSGPFLDLCAAPGGKATAIARRGVVTVAMDNRRSRVDLLSSNVASVGAGDLSCLLGDALHPPIARRVATGVLIDAPCSGIGVLRRRPDARWRLEASAPDRLAGLQRSMIDAAVPLLAAGGVLTYSVCTLTAVETLAIDDHVRRNHPGLVALDPPSDPWRPWGRGAILLPQTAGTDGMAMFSYRWDPTASPLRRGAL